MWKSQVARHGRLLGSVISTSCYLIFDPLLNEQYAKCLSFIGETFNFKNINLCIFFELRNHSFWQHLNSEFWGTLMWKPLMNYRIIRLVKQFIDFYIVAWLFLVKVPPSPPLGLQFSPPLGLYSFIMAEFLSLSCLVAFAYLVSYLCSQEL